MVQTEGSILSPLKNFVHIALTNSSFRSFSSVCPALRSSHGRRFRTRVPKVDRPTCQSRRSRVPGPHLPGCTRRASRFGLQRMRCCTTNDSNGEVEKAMLELSLGDICSATCPHCGTPNVFPGFSSMLAYRCRHSGEGVEVETQVQ